MCYNVVAKYQKMLNYALLRGNFEEAKKIAALLEEMQASITPRYLAIGFEKPELLVFTSDEPMKPQFMKWGLIPSWAGENFNANTLNAKVEEFREKPSYKKAKRCVVIVDGFYEHHHFGKQKIPFKIWMAGNEPMIIAGLWDESKSGKTVSIVTTTANEIMAKIHNTAGRMPLVIAKEDQEKWLSGEDVKPVESECLAYHTVAQLTGKNVIGNKPEIENEVIYPGFELH